MALGRDGLKLSDLVIIVIHLEKGVVDSQSLPERIDIKGCYGYPPWPEIQ